MLESIEACEATMYRLLISQLELEKLQTARDQQVAAAQKIFEADIRNTAADVAAETARLQQYYMTHLADIEKDGRKSLHLAYGVMGRRTCPEALKLANKAWTWKAVVSKLQSVFPGQFVRVADPEIDKEAVKEHFDRTRLPEFGMKVQQDESFYAEPTRPRAAE